MLPTFPLQRAALAEWQHAKAEKERQILEAKSNKQRANAKRAAAEEARRKEEKKRVAEYKENRKQAEAEVQVHGLPSYFVRSLYVLFFSMCRKLLWLPYIFWLVLFPFSLQEVRRALSERQPPTKAELLQRQRRDLRIAEVRNRTFGYLQLYHVALRSGAQAAFDEEAVGKRAKRGPP